MANCRKWHLLQFAKMLNQSDSIYYCLTNLKSGDLEHLERPKLDQHNHLRLGKTKLEKMNFEKFEVTTV